MSKESMKLALEALESIEWHGFGSCWVLDNEKVESAITALREALAQRKPLTEWVPLTQKLLNEQHEWLYEPMWIAMKDGSVLQGYYEWRQGWNPDRLLADGGDHWAFDAAYVMPIAKPAPPAIEAAHNIKENT